MFDFMKMFGGGAGGGMGNTPQGWAAGTTVNPQGAFFSRDLTGGISGFTPDTKSALGKVGGGMQSMGKAFGDAQPKPGAFAPPPNPNQDPNVVNAQAFYQAIQARRMQGR